MTGPVNLGTATGTVRVNYESSGASKAVSEIQKLQATLTAADQTMASLGKSAGLTQGQLASFGAIQDRFVQYAKAADYFQKKLESLQNSGIKGQRLIDAKGMAAQTRADLDKVSATYRDWIRYIESQKVVLPAPRVDVAGVQQNLAQLKSTVAKGVNDAKQSAQTAAGPGGVVAGALAAQNGSLTKQSIDTGKLAATGIGLGLKVGLSSAAAAVTAVVTGLGYTLTKGFQRLTSLDQAAAKLKALGYSAEQVKAISNSALEAVKGTAFGLDEAFTTAAAAINTGIKPGKQLTEYLKLVADNAALAGMSMQDMGYLFGKVATAGRLQGEELAIFMDRNIDVLGNVSKAFNVTRQEAQRMVTAGELDFAKFQKAMALNAGAAQTMGGSITGSFQNLKAAISRVGAMLLQPLFGNATGEASTFAKAIQWVTAQIGKLEAWLQAHRKDMIDFWAGFAKGAVIAAKYVTHFVGSATKDFGSLAGALADIMGAMASFDEFLDKIPGMGGNQKEAQSLRNWEKNLNSFADSVTGLGENVESVESPFNKAMQAIDDWAESSKNALDVTGDLGDKADDTTNKTIPLTQALEQLGVKADDVTKSLEGSNQQFAELIKNLKEKNAPQELIDTLTKLRNQFENGGRQVKNFADAIESFSDQTLSANDRATRFISTLQDLNLLPGGDQLASYNKALEEMVRWDNQLVDLNDLLGTALLNVDKATGKFNGTINTSTKNGNTLQKQIEDIREEMVAMVAAGDATPQQAFDRTAEGLRILLSRFGLTGDVAEQIINTYLPKPEAMAEALNKNVKGALSASGMDPLQIDTALNLLTQANDILRNIVGPDGKLHVPTVLDVQNQPGASPGPGANGPSVGNAAGAPAVPAGSPPVPGAGMHWEDGKGWVPDTGVAAPQPRPYKLKEGYVPQAPPELPWWRVNSGLGGPEYYWPSSDPERNKAGGTTLYAEQTLTQQEQEALKEPERVAAAWDALDETTRIKLRALKEQAESQGKNLAQAYAEGVFSGEEYLREAIKKLAQIAADGLGHSPAKYGPLSGKGWSYFRGQTFTKAWAEGIQSEAGTAKNAVAATAGTAVAPFGGGIEKMMKDLQEFSDLGQHIFDFINQMAGITFSVLDLAQTLSGGKLFPKTYQKSTAPKPLGSPLAPWQPTPNPQTQFPNTTTTQPGVGSAAGVGAGLKPGATKAQKQAAIIRQGQQLGLTPTEITAVLAVGQHESQWADIGFMGFGPEAKAAGFNFDANPQGAIDQFLKQYTSRKPAGLDVNDPKAVADYIWHTVHAAADPQYGIKLLNAMQDQQKEWNSTISTATQTALAPQNTSGSRASSLGEVDITPALLQQKGFAPLYTPGTSNVPQWVSDLASQFNLTASTYANGGTLHQAGFAFDFNGSPADRERFAQYIMNNLAGQTLQLIYDSGTTKYGIAGGTRVGPGTSSPGYYAGNWAGHADHVHWATDVAPILADANQNALQPTILTAGDNAANAFSTPLDPLGLPKTLQDLAGQDKMFSDAVAASQGTLKLTDEQVVPLLQHLDGLQADANLRGTPADLEQAKAIGQIRDNLMQGYGYEEGPTALQQAESIASGIGGIVGDVFGVVNATFESISSAKGLADTLARGIANTEDIYNAVEKIQSFIELGSRIASLTGNILQFAGGIVQGAGAGAAASGGDAGGTMAAGMAVSAAGSIASIISQVYSGINAAIDIGQEVYRIATKYIGRYLEGLFGFPGASDIRYLLDTVTGQLQVYTSENPQMKHSLNTLNRTLGFGYGQRQGPSNVFTIYQGPGQDPRDTMNDAMFAIKSSGVGAFGYAD